MSLEKECYISTMYWPEGLNTNRGFPVEWYLQSSQFLECLILNAQTISKIPQKHIINREARNNDATFITILFQRGGSYQKTLHSNLNLYKLLQPKKEGNKVWENVVGRFKSPNQMLLLPLLLLLLLIIIIIINACLSICLSV